MPSRILDAIFADDPDGLLDVKPKSSALKPDDLLSRDVQEINDFVEKHGREPSEDSDDIEEFKLAKRLKTLRNTSLKEKGAVYNADSHGLLLKTVKEDPVPQSIDDILNSADFASLKNDDNGLFDLKPAIKKAVDRDEADFVAQRRPCKEFKKYESMFRRIQDDLRHGRRVLTDSKISDLHEGGYYVYNGVVFYVESIDITQQDAVTPDGKHIYKNGRTRCIFENGTEAALLKRSVEKLLYLNGKTISENKEDLAKKVESELGLITEADEESGYIYVCSSKSKDSKITEIANLYKIGFCTTTVEERIKNAEKEPTYLMAPVKLITSWKCFNMNPQKFEQLIHNFFGKSCLNVDVFDAEGKRHIPKEWFIAPLPIIEQAVAMIVSGEIVHYSYDPKESAIVKRKTMSESDSLVPKTSAFKSRDIDSSVSMQALCVQQPWASLICVGIKDVENRTWTTSEPPGRILIVSSNKKIPRTFLDEIPYDCAKEIVKAIKMGLIPNFPNMPLGAAIGYCDVVAFENETDSIWDGGEGQKKWVIKNAHVFDEPVYNVRCALRLYDLEGFNPEKLPKAHKVNLKKD